MIKSKKLQLILVLVLACLCAPVSGAEPNEADIELKFEVSSEEQKWIIGKGTKENGRGPIRPSHVAVLFIRPGRNFPDFGRPAVMRSILSTSAGRLLSQSQVHLLSTGRGCISRLGRFGDTVPNHYHFRLYAVSEKNARKLAEAFMQVLTNQAHANAQPNRERVLEFKEKISETKAKIPEAEAKAQAALSEIAKLKTLRYYPYADEAKKIISELNKILVMTNVEVAGIKAKIREIEKYKSYKIVTEKAHLAALEQMLSEQNIELVGALAKEKAAAAARKEAERFCRLEEASKLPDYLKQELRQYESLLQRFENVLDKPDMIPPELFQNKVTIYPVRAED